MENTLESISNKFAKYLPLREREVFLKGHGPVLDALLITILQVINEEIEHLKQTLIEEETNNEKDTKIS